VQLWTDSHQTLSSCHASNHLYLLIPTSRVRFDKASNRYLFFYNSGQTSTVKSRDNPEFPSLTIAVRSQILTDKRNNAATWRSHPPAAVRRSVCDPSASTDPDAVLGAIDTSVVRAPMAPEQNRMAVEAKYGIEEFTARWNVHFVE
jgi:hypothetical protein